MKLLVPGIILLTSLLIVDDVQAQAPAYYYKGRHKVRVEVRTDAVAVKTTGPLPLAYSQSSATATLSGASSSIISQNQMGKRIIDIKAAQTVSELSKQAQLLRKAMPGAHAQAILTRPDQTGPLQIGKPAFLTNRISFQLPPDQSLAPLAARYGLENIHPVPYADRTYTATVDNVSNILQSLNTANVMQESGEAIWASPLLEETKPPRAIPNDPFFPNQWHLNNTGTNTSQGTAGNDLNTLTAWALTKGQGVNIAICDQGVETGHPDLMANVRDDLDYDFNDNDDDPTPHPTQSHGTSCAGVAAARGDNTLGVAGTAPEASIVGLRLIAEPFTDVQEAMAMVWQAGNGSPQNQVAIHSNSWGPPDGGGLGGPGPLAELAVEYGATYGRNGKGIVYVWAGGNGRNFYDNINKDRNANSPYVIAVGASDSSGFYAPYSEAGACLLVNAPSEGIPSGDGIYTTDNVGNGGSASGDYRTDFGGTSAAAPSVAGVVALMLDVNPNLTYRDVMHILVDTATRNDPGATEWYSNGAGLPFNHNYGFGRVDAGTAVAAAGTWNSIPSLTTDITNSIAFFTPIPIPDNSTTGVLVEIPIAGPPNFVIEHVELEIDITHPYRGDIAILLQSPSGMVSEMMWDSFDSGDDYDHWPFRSVAHWGESPSGTWRMLVADLNSADIGTINSAALRISGYLESTSSIENWELY